MIDVAAHAGVSLKTVSRVVNNEPDVNEQTAQRVQASILALGFRRNEGASSLRRGQSTASLGLILEDLADPFYSVLTRAVEEIARMRRFLVFTGSSDEDPAREQELALAFCARRVDGLVVVPTHADHGYLEPEIRAGVRVVFVDRPALGLEADEVLVDNKGGTRAAVEHLARHGHQRVAYLGDRPDIFTAQERLRGYREAMGNRADPELVAMGPHSEQSVRMAVERFRARPTPATAIITGNNRLSVLLLKVLSADSRWRPAVVGFDDVELSEVLDPPLTIVEQNPYALGQQAASLLFARLAGDRSPPRRVVLPVSLVPRGSGEVRP